MQEEAYYSLCNIAEALRTIAETFSAKGDWILLGRSDYDNTRYGCFYSQSASVVVIREVSL